MLTFELKFLMENAAFDDAADARDSEVARILREISDRVENGSNRSGPVYDINGNRIGSWRMDEED